jgi:hypothetical protein
MKRVPVRERLEEIAAGKAQAAPHRASINEVTVKKHKAEFDAWHRFATPQPGEPITAPSEILAPLP